MPCTHDIAEQETAVAFDGLCPLCLATEIARLELANRQSMEIADHRSAENCKLRQENERLRGREEMMLREAIDQAWGEALEDGSVPSTKLQNKIMAAIRLASSPVEQSGDQK